MTTILIILVILLFQGISTPVYARDNLMREATFESGEPNNGWSGTNKDTDTMSSVGITSKTSRRGNRSVMADRPKGTNRSEVSDRIKGRAPLHKRVMYGWSLRVDRNTNGNGRLIVAQIHHHQAGNKSNQWSRTASFLVRHDAGKRKFTLKHGYQIAPKKRKDNYKDLCKAQYRKWYDFVVQAKWTWRNDGYVKIWCNGKLVYDHEGSTYFDYGSKTKGPYWKAGAYTDRGPAEVYVDEYRMGNSRATYADVDPAGKDKPEPEPPPPDLPELRVERITWGETGTNHVYVRTRTLDPDADPHMDKRDYREGSVVFFSPDAEKGFTIHRQAVAPKPRDEGWVFYLDKPHPISDIHMAAETDWITGAPSINQLIPRWGEPEPDLPVLEMEPQQTATCDRSVLQLSQVDSKYLIECGKEK